MAAKAEIRIPVERERAPAAPMVRLQEHTSTSPNHPDLNHDSKRVSAKDGFAILCDGLGKSVDPQKASKKVATVLAKRMREIHRNADVGMVRYAMQFAFEAANRAVMVDVPGGRSTATAIKVVENSGQKYGVIGHVGDSRLGILRRDGSFEYITQDDTVAGQEGRVKDFELISTQEQYDSLPPEDKVLYDAKTKCIQKMGEPNAPHIYTVALNDGDRIVLHSDGVHDNLDSGEVSQALAVRKNNKAKLLTRRARLRSLSDRFRAKRDDITVIVMDIIPEPVQVQEVFHERKHKKLVKSGKK